MQGAGESDLPAPTTVRASAQPPAPPAHVGWVDRWEHRFRGGGLPLVSGGRAGACPCFLVCRGRTLSFARLVVSGPFARSPPVCGPFTRSRLGVCGPFARSPSLMCGPFTRSSSRRTDHSLGARPGARPVRTAPRLCCFWVCGPFTGTPTFASGEWTVHWNCCLRVGRMDRSLELLPSRRVNGPFTGTTALASGERTVHWKAPSPLPVNGPLARSFACCLPVNGPFAGNPCTCLRVNGPLTRCLTPECGPFARNPAPSPVCGPFT
ncbi:hypothetical protein LV78_007040 [Actinosynnema pretiosum]|nr:hypothetical protein [Actinosynnema pretiosum]